MSKSPSPPLKPPNRFLKDWPFLLGLALMGGVIFFYRLGAPGLMDPDEGRYAEIAREMWVLRDWLIPHLNLLPYLEKPPLVYWLTALSFGALGYTEAAARLPSALSALGGVFLAYGLGRAFWGPGVGFLAATVLASCTGYVALGRLLTLDMTFAFFLNLGVGLGYLAWSRGRPRLWLWAYLALGTAVLTKGPAAVILAGLIWVSWGLITRQGSLRPLVQPRGWLLLSVIALPWLVAVQWRYPEFFRFFVLEQHLGRYLTAAIHPQPFYFYVPVMLGFMLPWSWLLPWALAGKGLGRDPDRVFLMIWAAAILIFFSLSQGKLAPYVLPAVLPLALLLGQRLAGLTGEGRRDFRNPALRFSLLAWAVAGVVLAALYLWPPGVLVLALSQANLLSPYLLVVAAVFALTPILALARRQAAVLFLGALLLSALLPVGMEKLSVLRSPRELGKIVQTRWRPGAALIGVQLYSQGLSFYSGQVFHLWEFKSELDFGRRLQPGSGLFFADPEKMAKFAAARPLSFFFLKTHDLGVLRDNLPGAFHPVGHLKDCLLVVYEGK